MDNQSYWDEYEKVTGEKRPPWIDGVGNVNYSYGKKDLPAAPAAPARVTAQYMPQVPAAQFNNALMPQPAAVNPWRLGLRGWQPW